MSGECDKCGEHALECRCDFPPLEPEDWEEKMRIETEELIRSIFQNGNHSI